MKNREITGFENVPEALRGCVLTIGNFDGVHRGHQMLINTGRDLADREQVPLVAVTFNPAPDLVVRPNDKPQRVVPQAEKVRLLLEAGADAVVVAKADRELLSMTADEFIEQIILERFSPSHIVEGEDFCYGKGRSGSLEDLRREGKQLGFDVHCVEPFLMDVNGEPVRVSSTQIRGHVKAGRIAVADEMLGRPFELIGPVVGGEQVGRVLEYPTANIDPGEQISPCDGVYAGWATIEDKIYVAAISIGTKPTTGDKPRTIEANLLDASGDFYHKQMRLRFFRRLRDQEKFDSIEQLKEQIARDVAKTRELCQAAPEIMP